MKQTTGKSGASSAGGQRSKAPQRSVGKSRTVIQRYGGGAGQSSSGDVTAHDVASRGIGGPPIDLPFFGAIQSAFGAHDVSDIKAHTDSAAASASRDLGASAYATGHHIAFAGAPDLHTAAHEAAHVVQQRAGVQLKGGVGSAGDPYEQNADAVADRVVRGESAEDLLDMFATPSALPASPPLQRQTVQLQQAQPQPGPVAGSAEQAGGGHAGGGSTGPGAALHRQMFQVDGGEPALGGRVQARTSDGEVVVQAPDVTAQATISLREGVELSDGQRVEVGPTQTLLGSERTGVYRRGGQPDGEIVAHYRSAAGQLRDAMWREADGGGFESSFPEPWYGQPRPISNSARSAQVRFRDQPAMGMPASMSGGQLTEVRGADRFATSWSAHSEGSLVHLENFQWQVPWDVTVTGGRGDGGTVTGSSGGDGAPTTTGDIPMNAAREWFQFADVESAAAADTETLLRALDVSRGRDPDNFQIVAEGLLRKNPQVTAQIRVNSTDEWFSPDDVQITVRGSTTITRGPFTMNDRATRTISFALLDVIDPHAIRAGAVIEFIAEDVGLVSNSAHSQNWHFPFGSSERFYQMSGDGGDYRISVALEP